MSLLELKQIFEQRKQHLIQLLQEKPPELSIEKQHQIYGAILEIDNFLKAINYYRDLEVKKELQRSLQKPQVRKVLQ
ncbi:hypothetical protein J7L02_03495 [Candidatus Woesearchaeota archaeon]|nr:hypothetical protein [Candidatus Woesearchaeota archaeon]